MVSSKIWFFAPKYLSWPNGLTQHFPFNATFQLMLHFGNRPEEASWHKASTQYQSSIMWEVSLFLCPKISGIAWLPYQVFLLDCIMSALTVLYSGYPAEVVLRSFWCLEWIMSWNCAMRCKYWVSTSVQLNHFGAKKTLSFSDYWAQSGVWVGIMQWSGNME